MPVNSPLTVLAVDDSSSMLDFINIVLTGHPRLTLAGVARSGDEALRVVGRKKPDIIILDVGLPDMSGLEVARRILARSPNQCIVILTADERLESVKEALRIGVTDYLNKVGNDFLRAGEVILDAYDRCERRRSPKAKVWSFYAPKGNAGSTTLALNASFYLATLSYRTLLIDFDLLQGDVGFYLKLDRSQIGPNFFRWLKETDPAEAPADEYPIHTYSIRKDQGPYLDLIESSCSWIPRDGTWVQRLAAGLDQLSRRYEHIVVDLAPGRIYDEAVASMIDRSDHIFLVSQGDPSSTKSLVNMLKLLERAEIPERYIEILLSSISATPYPMARDLVQRSAGRTHKLREVPTDASAASQALLRGEPLVYHDLSSPLSRFVIDLVEDT